MNNTTRTATTARSVSGTPGPLTLEQQQSAHRLGSIALGGMATFAAIVAAMHLLEHDFDPMNRFVSEYVLGDWGLLMNAAFFAMGAALLALGLGLDRTLTSSRRVRTIRNLYVISGATAFISGVFNSNELVDGEVVEMTTSGAIHDIAGFVGFFCMLVASFLLRRAFLATPGWEHRAKWALLVAVANVVGLVATASPTDWFGLAQRAFLVLIVTWAIIQASWLRTAT